MRRVLRRCGIASALALLVAAPAPSALAQSHAAAEVAAELRAGSTVILSEAVLVGELDLRVAVVRGSFKCRRCIFQGPVRATDATFERTVDVTDSSFAKAVELSGTTFRGPALFRASPDATLVFRRRVDFSLAVFENIASFSDAQFGGAVTFEDARFADVTFAAATFDARAAFRRALFHSSASFSGVRFVGPADFSESSFRERADFGVSVFRRGATFTSAQFGRDASFLGSGFWAPIRAGDEEGQALEFGRVVSSGNLDFTFTTLTFAKRSRQPDSATAPSRPRQIADFDDIVCSRSLLLGETTFEDGGFDARLSMERVQVADLVLDVGATRRIGNDDDRRAVLESIERSAKTREDLGVANDAHFELRKLQSQTYGRFTRMLDLVFYRGIAGYFVRPFQPLLIFAVSAIVVAAWRYLRTRAPQSDSQVDEASDRSHWRSAGSRCGAFVTCLLDTFALAGPGRGGASQTASGLDDRILAIAFRVLLVCALIGFANSNPTLRNMVDTLL